MCSIDEASLARYLRRVEEGYPVGNPYHCRTHGADVVRAMYCLLTQGGVLQTVWPDEGAADMALLTGVFSAAIHDYEHKGVTVSVGGEAEMGIGVTSRGRSTVQVAQGPYRHGLTVNVLIE